MTHSFQTTTILYYTFFLPGVFIHELSYWLAAGMLNVHAKSSLQWPEAQEIAELDLSFVELDKNINPFKLALITLAPIVAGLFAVWLIANNILDFSAFFNTISSGELDDVGLAFRNLTSTADFWLWIYFLFVISNTMIPKLGNLKGLRGILIAIAIAATILIVIGVGEPVVLSTLTGPVTDALNLLSGAFVVMICIDITFVGVLGTIEAIIERITGHSAVFRRGKLVAMTRQEMLDARQRQARRDARALQRGSAAQTTVTSTIYALSFDIPGPPGEEPVTQSETVVIDSPAVPALPRRDDRRAPDIITPASRAQNTLATPAIKEAPPETKDASAAVPNRLATPAFRELPSRVSNTDPDDEDEAPLKGSSSSEEKVAETAQEEPDTEDDADDEDDN